jgi:hypothetical protein
MKAALAKSAMATTVAAQTLPTEFCSALHLATFAIPSPNRPMRPAKANKGALERLQRMIAACDDGMLDFGQSHYRRRAHKNRYA